MERWVLATLFASSGEPRDVYINMLFVTKMERVDNHTEVEFSSGTQVNVKELPSQPHRAQARSSALKGTTRDTARHDAS